MGNSPVKKLGSEKPKRKSQPSSLQSSTTGQPYFSPQSSATGQPFFSPQSSATGQQFSLPQSDTTGLSTCLSTYSGGIPTSHDQQNEIIQTAIGSYEATSDTANFCRLARLILDVCNDAMRDLLRCKISGGELILTQTIAQNRHKFERRLFEIQKNILFPPNNGLVKYKSLDFSALYSIVRNICPDKIEPNYKWGKSPASCDNSLGAAIERIRICRNTFFAHATEAKVSDSEFRSLWTDLELALNKIDDNLDSSVVSTSYKSEMKKLRKRMEIDPEVKNQLQRLTYMEQKWNLLIEMEEETDQKIQEIVDMRENYGREIFGCKRVYAAKDTNLGQTEVFLAKYIKENEFYVTTELFERVEQFLNRKKCVILVGKEGTGKTAIAVRLMFKFFQRKDFVVRKLRTPQDFSNHVDPTKNHLVFIDNIFDCSNNLLNDWWNVFEYMKELISYGIEDGTMSEEASTQPKVYIVMASRPHKLRNALKQMRYNHYILENHIVDFDSNDLEMNHSEKEQILQMKMKFAFSVFKTEEINFSDEQLREILASSPPFGFPLCAHLFACDITWREFGTQFFTNPGQYLFSRVKSIIKADISKQTEVLFVLVLAFQIRKEPFYYKDSEKSWEVLSELQITDELQLKKEDVNNMEELVIDRQEIYVRQSENDELQFAHPSVQEAVQMYFLEKYPKKAIEILPMHILFQNIRTECLSTLAPNLQSHFMRRLQQEIKNGNIREVCEYEELKNNVVSKMLLEQVVENDADFKDLLSTKSHGFPFMYWFTLAACNETVEDLLGHDQLKRVCSEGELYEQHFFSLLASCTLQEKLDVTKYILKKYSTEDIQNYYNPHLQPENKTKVYLSPLLVAVQNSNDGAIRLLTECGAKFNRSTWRGWDFLHACSKAKEWQISCKEILEEVFKFDEKNRNNHEDKYAEIISDESTSVFQTIVLKIESSIERHGSHKKILLCLVEIVELEITDKLIEVFCSLPDVKDSSDVHPLNFVDEMGNSVLHLLLKYRWYDQIQFNKNSNQNNVNLANHRGDNSCTASEELNIPNEYLNFHNYRIIEDGDSYLQTIRRLCDKNSEVNLKNKKGETPLMIEIIKTMPSIKVIKSLLHYGAHPNECDVLGQNCLHKLLSQSYNHAVNICEFLSILRDYGADLNKQDEFGLNSLFIELKNRIPRTEVIKFLIDANINTRIVDANGRSALNIAMQTPDFDDLNKREIVKILLCSEYSNVLTRDETEKSALHIAILYVQRNSELLKQIANHKSCEFPLHDCIREQVPEDFKIHALKLLLLENSKALNQHALNRERETLLITAAKACPEMMSLFRFLMNQNIDVNAKDVFQKTALDYLIESSNELEFKNRKATINCLLARKPVVHDEKSQEKTPLSRILLFMMTKSYLWRADLLNAPFKTKDQISINEMEYLKQPKDVFVDVEIVHNILEIALVDLNNFVDEKGRTYLHYCASTLFGDKQMAAICKRLVELNVDVNKKDKDGHTCVDMALKYTKKQNYNTLVYLLSSINLHDFDVDRSLQYLADGGNLYCEIVEYFIENIFVHRKPTKNILHYLASIGFDPNYLSKKERKELFNHLQSFCNVDEENDEKNIPLHIAIKETSSVSCVLNFLRISANYITKAGDQGNTALHLILGSDREDSDVCVIVKKILKYTVDVNAKNEFWETPLMVAVQCGKDRSCSIAYILKMKPDVNLRLKDRLGLTVLHHCIKSPKDDCTACSILSLFLDSRLPVPVNIPSEEGLTALNLAAKTVPYSRVLCILRLLQSNDCKADIVDDKGQSPLYNTAKSLQGTNPLVVLERLIRSYLFRIHGDSPYIKTNKKERALEVCKNCPSLSDLLTTDITDKEEVYSIIQRAWIDVASKILDKNSKCDDECDYVLRWNGSAVIDGKMKSLISDSIPYLSYRKLDLQKDEESREDDDVLSSILDLEQVL